MDIQQLTTAEQLQRYAQWVTERSHGSLWQSLDWKQYQEALEREVRIYAALEDDQIVASALVVIDRTTFGLSTWDIPRGPLWGVTSDKKSSTQERLINYIIADAKTDKCISLYLSPTEEWDTDTCHLSLVTCHSNRHEQPEATRIIDLIASEDEILAQMKPKGRYNIKVAQKHGVRIEESKDVTAFHTLTTLTGNRDRFTTLSKKQYQTFLEQIPDSFLLLAYPSSQDLSPGSSPEAIAGLLGVVHGDVGIYYYGASDHAHRAIMAPYALQLSLIHI